MSGIQKIAAELREREKWIHEALFGEPEPIGIVSALTIDEIYCQEIMSELRRAADALERQQTPAAQEGVSSAELPCLVVEDPGAFHANLNMRDWVRAAVEAKGAKFTGGGFGADSCDLDIELEGFRYNITITPLPPPPSTGERNG